MCLTYKLLNKNNAQILDLSHLFNVSAIKIIWITDKTFISSEAHVLALDKVNVKLLR